MTQEAVDLSHCFLKLLPREIKFFREYFFYIPPSRLMGSFYLYYQGLENKCFWAKRNHYLLIYDYISSRRAYTLNLDNNLLENLNFNELPRSINKLSVVSNYLSYLSRTSLKDMPCFQFLTTIDLSRNKLDENSDTEILFNESFFPALVALQLNNNHFKTFNLPKRNTKPLAIDLSDNKHLTAIYPSKSSEYLIFLKALNCPLTEETKKQLPNYFNPLRKQYCLLRPFFPPSYCDKKIMVIGGLCAAIPAIVYGAILRFLVKMPQDTTLIATSSVGVPGLGFFTYIVGNEMIKEDKRQELQNPHLQI